VNRFIGLLLVPAIVTIYCLQVFYDYYNKLEKGWKLYRIYTGDVWLVLRISGVFGVMKGLVSLSFSY